MVDIWHPDAIDAIDDYLGDLSRFSDVTTHSLSGQDTWITSMTISHWHLETQAQELIRNPEKNQAEATKPLHRSRFAKLWEALVRKFSKTAELPRVKVHTSRSDPRVSMLVADFPPMSVGMGRLATIRTLSLTVTITGDLNGLNWICTIISDLFDEGAVFGYANEAAQILQMFIHQQFTGRTLVFALVLGYLCESLAVECERFCEEVDHITDMDVSF